MITLKDHKQGYLFDQWRFLGPKRRKLLDESWAGLFQRDILGELPVNTMASFFKPVFGRPTKELYTVLGVLILQQMHDLSDEETIAQLAFNIQWHFALNIPEESDVIKYICPKTLWSMRKIVTDNELDVILFNQITGKLANVFKVDTTKQRSACSPILVFKDLFRAIWGRPENIFVPAAHNYEFHLKMAA